jgi:hypothetical protein
MISTINHNRGNKMKQQEILSNILWILAAIFSISAVALPAGTMTSIMFAWVSVIFCLIAFVNETAILLAVK